MESIQKITKVKPKVLLGIWWENGRGPKKIAGLNPINWHRNNWRYIKDGIESSKNLHNWWKQYFKTINGL